MVFKNECVTCCVHAVWKNSIETVLFLRFFWGKKSRKKKTSQRTQNNHHSLILFTHYVNALSLAMYARTENRVQWLSIRTIKKNPVWFYQKSTLHLNKNPFLDVMISNKNEKKMCRIIEKNKWQTEGTSSTEV